MNLLTKTTCTQLNRYLLSVSSWHHENTFYCNEIKSPMIISTAVFNPHASVAAVSFSPIV